MPLFIPAKTQFGLFWVFSPPHLESPSITTSTDDAGAYVIVYGASFGGSGMCTTCIVVEKCLGT